MRSWAAILPSPSADPVTKIRDILILLAQAGIREKQTHQSRGIGR
jgi:hypothetical protein